MTIAILIISILIFLLLPVCADYIINSVNKSVDESLAELLTYAINIDKVREKAKEHPNQSVELDELL